MTTIELPPVVSLAEVVRLLAPLRVGADWVEAHKHELPTVPYGGGDEPSAVPLGVRREDLVFWAALAHEERTRVETRTKETSSRRSRWSSLRRRKR